MEAKEIRIGNLVECFQKVNEIVSIDSEDKIVKLKEGTLVHCDDISPIKLTEEWLLKFGFKKNKTGFYSKGRLEFHTKYGWKILENWVKDWFGVSEIIYVHQLQNLYFALTGTELTFKI